MLAFQPESTSVTVAVGEHATLDFTLCRDPLQLQTIVVTGTQTPRLNLDASVAVTTLTASEIEAAAPRSTTEMLRYVPGFTRVESPINVTRQGFRHFLPNYVSGTGQTTIASGVVGGEFRLMDRVRADLGMRVEYNTYVQNSENTSAFDLDGDPATLVDNEAFGNNSFRHFSLSLTDWSASVGLNFFDELINASGQEQVDLFEGREVRTGELGVKYAAGRVAVTLNGFYTQLRNVIGQDAIVDPVTGASTWRSLSLPKPAPTAPNSRLSSRRWKD